MSKIWECKIGEVDTERLGHGADLSMRQAVREAYTRLAGQAPNFIFSGWGGALTENERVIVDEHRVVRNKMTEEFAEKWSAVQEGRESSQAVYAQTALLMWMVRHRDFIDALIKDNRPSSARAGQAEEAG